MPPCAGDRSHLSPVCAFREPSHSARRDGWTSMLWTLADASSFETRWCMVRSLGGHTRLDMHLAHSSPCSHVLA